MKPLERTFPKLFPFGTGMLEWIRQGGSPERVGKATQLAMRWHTFWFERQLARQQRLTPQPEQARRDPVLIVGLWRSGTTSIHNQLARLPRMITPMRWQCMSPATVRTRRPPRASRRVDPFSPQEEELALLALGAPSVYRAFFDPRRLLQLSCWLDETSWTGAAFSEWLNKWLEFSDSISAGKKGRLLLKSPTHTFRIRALTQALPTASYVWLVREPVATFLSNRKLWLSMFQRYALWNWSPAELDTFLLGAMDAAARSLLFAIGALPPDKLVIVEFERLVRAPMATSEAIENRLGLIEGVPPKSSRLPSGPPADGINAARQSAAHAEPALPPAAAETLARLRAAMQAAIATHGLAQ